MKKKVFLSIILILLVVFTSFAYATEDLGVMPISEDVESSEGATIPEEWRRAGTTQTEFETISESYAMFDENTNLQDTIVDGNMFAFGANVSLNNVIVYGDIFIAGQNITLSNITVYGTAFLAGETINMNNASFSGNIFNASQTMNFTGVAQDIFVASQNLSITEGSMVARELFATAEKTVLSGNVGKNAYISTQELTIMPTANIAGTLNYSSNQEANISSESTVGVVEFNKIEENTQDATSTTTSATTYTVVTIAIKSIFVCGFIFLFAKGFMKKQEVENIAAYIGKSTLKGLGWAIIIPVIGILFLFTGISLGLSFTVFALYSIILWASVPIVAIAITSNIKMKNGYNAWKSYGYSILISIVIAILKQLPIIGGIITFIVGIAAIGIIMSSIKRKKDKKEKDGPIKAEVVE